MRRYVDASARKLRKDQPKARLHAFKIEISNMRREGQRRPCKSTSLVRNKHKT